MKRKTTLHVSGFLLFVGFLVSFIGALMILEYHDLAGQIAIESSAEKERWYMEGIFLAITGGISMITGFLVSLNSMLKRLGEE